MEGWDTRKAAYTFLQPRGIANHCVKRGWKEPRPELTQNLRPQESKERKTEITDAPWGGTAWQVPPSSVRDSLRSVFLNLFFFPFSSATKGAFLDFFSPNRSPHHEILIHR